MATLTIFTAKRSRGGAPSFHYQFRTQLDGTFYRFRFQYTARTDSWWVSLFDDLGAPIVVWIRVVISSDLFAQYRHLGVPPGQLRIVDAAGVSRDPGRDDLGSVISPEYVEAVA